MLILNLQFPPSKLKNFVRCKDIDNCLAQLLYNDNLAVAVSRIHATNTIYAPHIFCLPNNENIYNYSVSLLIRKNHCLFERINGIVYRSFETGLLAKWMNDGENRGHKCNDEHPYRVKLAIEHIAGALIGYVAIAGIAVMALIAEIVVHNKNRQRNVHPFWRLVGKLIDNNHYGAVEIFNDVRRPRTKNQQSFILTQTGRH